jgi:hypothetical protein
MVVFGFGTVSWESIDCDTRKRKNFLEPSHFGCNVLAAQTRVRYPPATMKPLTIILCSVALLGLTMNATAADKLQHVVSIKFKPAAAAADIKKVEEAFSALKQKIPEVVSLEWGTNVSKEKKDKGFTHCFILSFKSEKDRDTYIAHPEHKAFGKILGPVLDDVFVIDFWSKS